MDLHLTVYVYPNSFDILDHAATAFLLKIKGTIHMQWEQPSFKATIAPCKSKTLLLVIHCHVSLLYP